LGLFEFLSLKIKNSDVEPTSSTVVSDAAATAFFKASAIETAISYKANALSMSNFRVFEKHQETQGKLWYLLNYSPNPNQNSSHFWNKFMHRLVLHGEVLIAPINNKLYIADGFTPDEHPLGQDVYTNVSIGGVSVKQPFRANRAYYFKLDDENVAAQVNGALDAYSTMLATAMAVYKNECATKFKVTLDRPATGDKDRQREQQEMLSDNLRTFMNNANAVYMETAGQKLEPVKTDNTVEPADITALRKDIYDAAAIAMKIPKSIMYGDMTNIGDIVNVMLTFAVDPEAKMISREITRKEFTAEEVAAGSRVFVDTSTVKHTELFDVASDAMNLISSGVATVDDLLEALGREPEGTDFTSQRWMTKNIGRAEDALAGEIETSTPTPTEGGDNND
jgi:HK97 family phage portal protein